jgi:Arc/MetJ family transcription regulator
MEKAAMRTTLNIDDELLQQAQELTGISEKTALVRAALQSLVERETSRRLAKLGGTQPKLKPIPRRRVS